MLSDAAQQQYNLTCLFPAAIFFVVIFFYAMTYEWLPGWLKARYSGKPKKKRELSYAENQRRLKAKRYLNRWLDERDTCEGSYTLNGSPNLDLERYGAIYGIDPNDEQAKRDFLSDLDEDEERG